MKSNRVLAAMLAASVLAACGGDGSGPVDPPPPPPPPPGPVTIAVQGTPERSGIVTFNVRQDGTPLDSLAFTLSASPAAAVQFTSRTSARLLNTGTVRFTATAAGVTGDVDVNVVAPPSVLFESIQDGNRDIWRVALDGADLVRVTTHGAEERSPTSAAGSVYYLSYSVNPAAIFSSPAASGNATRQTTDNGAYTEPAISPDGTQLLFTRPVGGVGKVFVSARNGSGARRLTASPGGVIEVSPAWSRNGANVVFVSTLAGNADIYVVPAAGGEARMIAGGSQPDVEPSFSPDGSKVVFARGSGGEVDLFTVPTAGGEATRLTTAPGTEARALWLADGRIVFTRDVAGAVRLFWLNPATPTVHVPIQTAAPISSRPAELR